MNCAKKTTLTSTPSSQCHLIYTTLNASHWLRRTMAGLNTLISNREGFPWGIKAMEISKSQTDERVVFKIPMCLQSQLFLTADCMTKLSSRGHLFHTVSHCQVSSQVKHTEREHLTHTQLQSFLLSHAIEQKKHS